MIGAVIVTYNPDENLVDLIKEIEPAVDKIVIVDNHSSTIPEIISTKLVWIKNKENLGLACALNQGCLHLLNLHYDYAITFDQDSVISKESILHMVNIIKREKCAVVGPNIAVKLNDGYRYNRFLVEKNKHIVREYVNKGEIKQVYVNITSGSLMDLKIWNAVGRFWSELFIEGIDNEFCLRLRDHGYAVVIDGDATLYQQCGNLTQTVNRFGITWMPTNHSALRYELMYRNMIWIKRKHRNNNFSYILFTDLAYVKRFLTVCFADEEPKAKILAIIKGIRQGYKAKI